MSDALDQGRDSRQNLGNAIKAARKARGALEPFWKTYNEEIKGNRRKKGKGPKRLTNYPYLFERTFLSQLSAKNPDVVVRPTLAWSDAPIAEAEQLALSECLRRQKFISELRLCVKDGFYAFMYRKVGMYAASPSDLGGGADLGSFYGDPMWLDNSMPFFERISPFDALWDDSAEDFKRTVYCGHEFERDLDAVINDERYDQAARSQAENKRQLMRERTRKKYEAFDDSEIPPICNLIELFVRPTRQIYTLMEVSESEFVVLRKSPFYGPALGPYDMRAFSDNDEVPGMAPAAAWWEAYVQLELNEQKANEQAQAEKRVVTAESNDAESAKRYKAAKSDDLVLGVAGIKEVHTGGVTPERMAWIGSRGGALEKLSGVTSSRLGVAEKGKTATAEYIAEANADTGDKDMRRVVQEFAESGLDDMRWYFHNEPSSAVLTTVMSPEGLPAEVMVRGGPQMDMMTGAEMPGQSPAELFHTTIEPKSLFIDGDEMKQAKAVQDATFVLSAVRPFLMQQGMDLNAMGFVRQLEQNAGLAGLSQNIVPMSPLAMQMMSMAAMGAPTAEGVQGMAQTGGDKIQSQVMNSPETNTALSEMGTLVSPGRISKTDPRSLNKETSFT